jgi:hypothetical protein
MTVEPGIEIGEVFMSKSRKEKGRWVRWIFLVQA